MALRSRTMTRVWLGWDDGKLFYSKQEQSGLDQAYVPQDLLDAFDAAHRTVAFLESELWGHCDGDRR